MVLTLHHLSLVAVANSLWDKYQQQRAPSVYHHFDHLPAVKIVTSRLKTLNLPESFKLELRQVVLEFGKRRLAKELSSAMNTNININMKNFNHQQRPYRLLLPIFFAESVSRMRAPPALSVYFPENPLRRKVIDFFFALMLTNPCEDPCGVRATWTSRDFLPCQAMFVEHFGDIWEAIATGLNEQSCRSEGNGQESNAIFRLIVCMRRALNNGTLPWFVFEVLDEAQRQKFFRVMQSPLVAYGTFRFYFQTMFSHWPWQEEAFERCFVGNEKLNDHGMALLLSVLASKEEEKKAMEKIGMADPNPEFYVHVRAFKVQAQLRQILRGT